jgi:hypothetical protein
MKKIFTFLTATAFALTINAQVHEDGTGFKMGFDFEDGDAAELVEYEGVTIEWWSGPDELSTFTVADGVLQWHVDPASEIVIIFDEPLDLSGNSEMQFSYTDFWPPEWVMVFFDVNEVVSAEILPIGLGIMLESEEWNTVTDGILMLDAYVDGPEGTADITQVAQISMFKAAGDAKPTEFWQLDDIIIGEEPEEVSVFDRPASNLVSLYPNPSNGLFNLSREVDEVTVYNSMGQEILQEADFRSNMLDLRGQNTGMYLIKVEFDGKEAISKVLIQ